jgi:ADP-ribose pyrophosphatase
VLEVVELPLREAIGRIGDGTICDGKTIVGLQVAFLRGLGF